MFVEDLKSNYIGYGLPKKFIDCIQRLWLAVLHWK